MSSDLEFTPQQLMTEVGDHYKEWREREKYVLSLRSVSDERLNENASLYLRRIHRLISMHLVEYTPKLIK